LLNASMRRSTSLASMEVEGLAEKQPSAAQCAENPTRKWPTVEDLTAEDNDDEDGESETIPKDVHVKREKPAEIITSQVEKLAKQQTRNVRRNSACGYILQALKYTTVVACLVLGLLYYDVIICSQPSIIEAKVKLESGIWCGWNGTHDSDLSYPRYGDKLSGKKHCDNQALVDSADWRTSKGDGKHTCGEIHDYCAGKWEDRLANARLMIQAERFNERWRPVLEGVYNAISNNPYVVAFMSLVRAYAWLLQPVLGVWANQLYLWMRRRCSEGKKKRKATASSGSDSDDD